MKALTAETSDVVERTLKFPNLTLLQPFTCVYYQTSAGACETDTSICMEIKPVPQKEKRGRTKRRVADAHHEEIYRLLSKFLDYADSHPLHRFAEGTQKFLREVRPVKEQLDAIEGKSEAASSKP